MYNECICLTREIPLRAPCAVRSVNDLVLYQPYVSIPRHAEDATTHFIPKVVTGVDVEIFFIIERHLFWR